MKTKRKLTMAAVGLFALVATTDLLMMSSAQAQPPPGPVAWWSRPSWT